MLEGGGPNLFLVGSHCQRGGLEGLPIPGPRGRGWGFSLAPSPTGGSHLGFEPQLTEQAQRSLKNPTSLMALPSIKPASGGDGQLYLRIPPLSDPKLLPRPPELRPPEDS